MVLISLSFVSSQAGRRGRQVKIPEHPQLKFRSSPLRQEAIPPQFFPQAPTDSSLPSRSHIVFTKEEYKC